MVNGTNQGVKHYLDYLKKSPRRIASIEERLGLKPGTFDGSLKGFEKFTEQAMRIVRDGIPRYPSYNKSVHFMPNAQGGNNGVIVIMRGGKLQSMMAGPKRSFNKAK